MPLNHGRRGVRGGLPAVLATAILATACGDRPQDGPRWREQWEVLGVTEDGSLIDARIAVGNTGLLRGQGHLRVDRWFEDRDPILYGRDVGPVEVDVAADRGSVRLGLDGLDAVRDDEGMPLRTTLQARDQEASAVVHATTRLPGQAPLSTRWQEGGGEWALEATLAWADLSGWLGAGDRGGLVAGRGVVLHRGGDGQPAGARTTLLAMGQEMAVVVDQQGEGLLAWAVRDGRLVELGAPEVFDVDGWPRTVRFADGPELTLRRRGVRGERLPYEHLTGIEQRLLAWTGGWKARRVVRSFGTIRWDGVEELAPAMWVRVVSADYGGGGAVLPAAPDAVTPGADAPGTIASPPPRAPGASTSPE